MQNDELLTIQEAAKLLKVSVRTMRRKVHSGAVAAYRLPGGQELRFKRDEVLAALEPVVVTEVDSDIIARLREEKAEHRDRSYRKGHFFGTTSAEYLAYDDFLAFAAQQRELAEPLSYQDWIPRALWDGLEVEPYLAELFVEEAFEPDMEEFFRGLSDGVLDFWKEAKLKL